MSSSVEATDIARTRGWYPTIELCVVVQMVFDDVVTLASFGFESAYVGDVDYSPGVFNEPFFLQNCGRLGDCGPGVSQHVGEKFIGHLVGRVLGPVRADEQPSGKTLVHLMLRIASSRLHGVDELRLDIPECKRLKNTSPKELRQLDGITLEKRFIDKDSGKDMHRPQLHQLTEYVREGDTVVRHAMDRLARNLDDLRKIVLGPTERGVHVRFEKEKLIFTREDSPMSHLLLSVMGAFAQFERDLIRERQREGIALAMLREGAYVGRKHSLTL